MNSDKLLKQMQEKFSVHKEERADETTITIYPKNSDGGVNLDTGIKLKNNINSNLWRLFEVQRDQEYELGSFNGEDLGIVALYVSVKGKFDRINSNEQTREEIRSIGNDLIKGQTILHNNLNDRYFSFNKEKEGAINVFEQDGKYYIYFLSLGKKIWISKARPMKSALVVTYNFAILLEEFDNVKKTSLNDLDISSGEEELLRRIYIGV